MASKKKISQKTVNKETAKKVRATARNLKAVSKAIAKGVTASATGARKSKAKPTSKQIKATAKSAKKLVKVFRDAFGRFTKAPSAKPKSKHTTSQRPSSSKRQPKKEQTKQAKKKASSKVKTKSKRKVSAQKPPKKQPTKKPTPKTPKKASKKSFTLRSLRPKAGESTLDFFDRIEADEDAFDALKGKDEYWVFTYANGKSRRVYKNIGLAIKRMRQYDLTKQVATEPHEQIDIDLVESIHFTRFAGKPLEYVMPNEERIRQRNAERVRIRREAKRILGKEQAPDFGGNIDLVEGLSKQNAALLERIKKLEDRKDESTTKRVSKAGAKGKSRSTKKGATRKANSKKSK